MNLIDYFLIFLALAAQAGIGRIFVRGDMLSLSFAGMLLNGGVISVIAWVAPKYISGYILLFSFVGLGLFSFFVWRKEFSLKTSYTEAIFFVVILLFFIFFFRELHYTKYLYESHDVLYFTPALEMLKANYLGHLKLFVYYPNEMASSHLLPGAILATTTVFLKEPTIITLIESRYILAVLFFTRFIYAGRKLITRDKFLPYFVFPFVLLHVFGQEINYNLTISSFIYVFILLELSNRIIFYSDDKKSLLYFSIFLISAKGPIFYSAVVLSFYYWYIYAKYRFSVQVLVPSLVVLCIMISWLVIPLPYPGEDIQLKLMNPFALFHSLDLAENFKGWTLSEPITMFIKSQFSTSMIVVPLFVFILSKYYFLFFAFSKTIKKKLNSIDKIAAFKGIEIYLIASLLGWLVFRNGISISHQAHGYLLAAIVVYIYLTYFLVQTNNKIVLFIIAILFLPYIIKPNLFSLEGSHIREGRIASSKRGNAVLQYRQLPEYSAASDVYMPLKNEEPSLSMLKAAMYGKRLLANSISEPKGQIAHWVRTPSKK